jgi:hypothetical protein
MNQIAQIKTLPVNGSSGASTAMMIAINIREQKTIDAFISDVAEQFKVQRTIAPPNTSLLLVTIIGDLSADQFSQKWKSLESRDAIIRGYMSLMTRAEVIQATPAGKQLSVASLIAAG